MILDILLVFVVLQICTYFFREPLCAGVRGRVPTAPRCPDALVRSCARACRALPILRREPAKSESRRVHLSGRESYTIIREEESALTLTLTVYRVRRRPERSRHPRRIEHDSTVLSCTRVHHAPAIYSIYSTVINITYITVPTVRL